jgi:hypothetical protein
LKNELHKHNININCRIHTRSHQAKDTTRRKKTSSQKLPEELKTGRHAAPKGFINETIRETTKTLAVYVFDASVALRAWKTS